METETETEKARTGGEKAVEDRADQLILSYERIEAFLAWQRERHRAESTIERYRTDLEKLYAWLPEDKNLTRERLTEWKETMQRKGIAVRTINTRLSAANSFLAFAGRRDLQMFNFEKGETENEPILQRQEYLRLLQAARDAGNKKLYLLIKLFGTTGISIQNLRNVTVEAVNRGVVCTGEKDYVIPAYLLNDMKTYVKEEHIGSGPIFITKAGKPLNRTVVNSIMKTLSAAAQVEEEKITPRCLKKMYQETRAFFEQRVNDLVERAYEQLLSTEQTLVGWDPAPELFYEEEQEKEKQR